MLEANYRGHHAEVFSPTSPPQKKVFAQKFSKFSQNSSVLPKKGLQNFVSHVLWLAPALRWNNIAHDLGPFLTSQKIVLSSIRGLAGFEAENLTFKDNDFKLCPRGQERPKGLHLCCLVNFTKHLATQLSEPEISHFIMNQPQNSW